MAAPIDNIRDLEKQVGIARKELKNMRQQIETMKHLYRKDVRNIQEVLFKASNCQCGDLTVNTNRQSSKGESSQGQDGTLKSPAKRCHDDDNEFTGSPIGYLESCFREKNGTPRQPTVCTASKAKLQICQTVFNNPSHALQGLEKYSHVWIIFVFHKNGSSNYSKAKVKPPRLDGFKVGLFSTRSPHRPNPIGLTLAQLDRIQDDTLYLSGVDMIDGTPVLDLKPYIPMYDNPLNRKTTETLLTCKSSMKAKPDQSWDTSRAESNELCRDDSSNCEGTEKSRENEQREDVCMDIPDGDSTTRVAPWICQPVRNSLNVRFTSHAEQELQKFRTKSKVAVVEDPEFTLELLSNPDELKASITDILQADPRSTYRSKHCQDSLYYFSVDSVHVTCWFGEDFAEVIRIQPTGKAKTNEK